MSKPLYPYGSLNKRKAKPLPLPYSPSSTRRSEEQPATDSYILELLSKLPAGLWRVESNKHGGYEATIFSRHPDGSREKEIGRTMPTLIESLEEVLTEYLLTHSNDNS